MAKKTLNLGSYEEFESKEELLPEEIELLESARLSCNTSYSPYSNFQVGAAVRLGNGKIINGSNQENASYPAGLCAERVALFAAGANFKNEEISQIAVAARRNGEEKFVTAGPCGSCRQVMLEFEHKQQKPISLLMQSGESRWIKIESCRMLLPFSFDKDSL